MKNVVACACAALAVSVAMGFPGDDGEGRLELHECPLLPKETKAEKDARMAWWAEARFGMFIHFGLYATLGRHEWVQKYEKISPEDYERRYMKRFNPDRYDAKDWVARAKSAGMKYIVLTTKHHEGFCMWDTKTTDYKITNTPFRRDVVREYVDACRAAGIRVGFYYSIIDWHHPEFRIDDIHPLYSIHGKEKVKELNARRDMAKYREYMMRQVTELMTDYGPVDVLFFDFTHPGYHAQGKNGREDYHSEELLALVRKLQPRIIVNDRLGLSDTVGGWDMKTPEQIVVPKCPRFNGEDIYWETCQTFSGSWGYFRDEDTWKSPRQLLGILIDSVSKKGNLLLNVGPTARGLFDHRACDRLDAMGKWMAGNSRSIYGCTAAPEALRKQCPEGCKMTYNPKTNTLYLHILEWPVKVLPITFSDQVEYAQFLHDASEVQIKQPKHVSGVLRKDVPASLMLPVKKPNEEIPVVEMFLRSDS